MMQEMTFYSREVPGEGVTQKAISAQLARIHASPRFARSPRLCQLLSYLVENSADGNARKLLEFTIGVDVFGRGESFDPQSDTIVRVTVRRLRRFLADYYEAQGRDDPLIFLIPTGHYRVDFHQRIPFADPGAAPTFYRQWRRWIFPAAAAVLAATAVVDYANVSPPVVTPDVTAKSQAAQHILLGQHLVHRRGPGDLQQAVTEFERAVAEDARNVDGWIGLASALGITALHDPDQNRKILPRQYWAINQALVLAPSHPEVNARMARLHAYAGDLAGATRFMRRALASGSENILVLGMLAGQERASGNLQLALQLQRKAASLPPLDIASLGNLAYMLYEAGELDEALELYDRLEKFSPQDARVKAMIVKLHILRGDFAEAEQRLQDVSPGAERHQLRALVYHSLGQAEASRQASQALAEQASSPDEKIMLAEIFAYREERGRAMDEIDAAFAQILNQGLLPALMFSQIRTLLDSPFLQRLYDDAVFLAWADGTRALIASEAHNLLTLAALGRDDVPL